MTSIITQPRTLVQCVVGGGGADLPALKFGNFQWQIEDTENDQATSRRPTRPLSPLPGGLPDQPQIHVHGAQTRSVGVSSVPKHLEK